MCCVSDVAASAVAAGADTNMDGGWVGASGTINFNFMHRFTNSGPPERQVTNYPTFLLGYPPFASALMD